MKKPSRTLLSAVVVLPLAALLVGCSSGTSQAGASSSAPTPYDAGASSAPATDMPGSTTPGQVSETPVPGGTSTGPSTGKATPGASSTPTEIATGRPAPDATATASLVITVIKKPGDEATTYKLSCTERAAKPESSLPMADEGCDLTVDHPEWLLPTLNPGKAPAQCTQQYGGPATATILGTLRGKDVNLSLNRKDGCGIAKWEQFAPLLGEAGANL